MSLRPMGVPLPLVMMPETTGAGGIEGTGGRSRERSLMLLGVIFASLVMLAGAGAGASRFSGAGGYGLVIRKVLWISICRKGMNHG